MSRLLQFGTKLHRALRTLSVSSPVSYTLFYRATPGGPDGWMDKVCWVCRGRCTARESRESWAEVPDGKLMLLDGFWRENTTKRGTWGAYYTSEKVMRVGAQTHFSQRRL